MPQISKRSCIIIGCLIIIFVLYKANIQSRRFAQELDKLTTTMFYPLWAREIDFEGFDNNTGTENGCYLVPNIIHFLKLDETTFSFIEMICFLAAYKRQRPNLIYIHTNVDVFVGKYWDYMKNINGIGNVLIIRPITIDKGFVAPMKNEWKTYHERNLIRIYILMEFGGIFLDKDIYLVKDLHDFRRFEMTLGWKPGKAMGSHILIAHRSARFLKEYLDSYRREYSIDRMMYNAAIKPTVEILQRKPYLVHRVEEYLGTYVKASNIYMKMWKNWREYYSIRLLLGRHYFLETVLLKIKYPKSFEDTNIRNFKNITFFEIVNEFFDADKRQVR